jgi:rubrerythrin
MTVTLNSIAVFEIAERIERNGAAFYRRAAQLFDARRVSGILLDLAKWEDKHERVFARMRAQLPKQDAEPVAASPQQGLDPQVMAGLAVFGMRADPAEELRGNENRADILAMALQKEKNSIVFYHGLNDFIRIKGAKHQVDRIIREEMRHVVTLSELLKEEKRPYG